MKGGKIMATSSIYHNIKIKNKNLLKGLLLALEHPKIKKSKDVVLTQRCQKVSKEDIKKFFNITTGEDE